MSERHPEVPRELFDRVLAALDETEPTSLGRFQLVVGVVGWWLATYTPEGRLQVLEGLVAAALAAAESVDRGGA